MTDPMMSAGAESPAYDELGTSAAQPEEVPLSMLLDLSLQVSIQLERLAGEPIDIYVGDRRFAEGEVLVINEHFGIRITRIVSATAGEGAA